MPWAQYYKTFKAVIYEFSNIASLRVKPEPTLVETLSSALDWGRLESPGRGQTLYLITNIRKLQTKKVLLHWLLT